MAIISLIAAIDEDNGLGFNQQLLCYLPIDLQHFKKITMGKPIIMGRKTFESIKKTLPGRTNIVLSRSLSFIEGAVVMGSLAEALSTNAALEELIIIGGAEIYAQAIELATRLYITRIHHHFKADVFFPSIEESVWNCKNKQVILHDEKNPYDITLYTYEKKVKRI